MSNRNIQMNCCKLDFLHTSKQINYKKLRRRMMMTISKTIFIKDAGNQKEAQTVESLLTQLNGVERALVDMGDGEVKIEFYENQITFDEILQRIEQQGLTIADKHIQ
ncbi:heavy-metal-associated domain-containing protein [Metabacillus arenae]|nr:heavy-metal-associated domain-containing protein [Metabacillus arenae]